MSRLSRLLAKLNLAEETKPPKAAAPPEIPSGRLTITINASRHIVEAVTLFRNDTAQVVRTFHDLKLKYGENTVVIDNLPHAMQPESLRVSNSGLYATLDVLCTRERNDDHQRRLEVLVAELEQTKKRREEVMKMLRDFGNSMAITSTTSQKNMFKFTDKYLSVAEEYDTQVREIEQKLKEEKASLDTWRNSQMSFRGVAQITLFTKRNITAALTITYMVNNASWSPLYDLRAVSVKGRPSPNVHLHYRANLSQSTGEDWKDAQLTLSTRAPEDLDGGIPRANTVQIRGAEPQSPIRSIGTDRPRPRPMLRSRTPPQIAGASRSRSRSPIRPRSRPRSRGRSLSRSRSRNRSRSRSRSRSRTQYRRCRSPSESPRRLYSPIPRRMLRDRSPIRRSRGSITASEPPQHPFHPNEMVMASTDVRSVSFIMDGRCSVLGDGKLHRVTIAILPFTATIHHVVTPRVSYDAYLQCTIPNDSAYTLLPGVLSTFLDEKYVSKVTIPEVRTGAALHCTLGIDPAIKVTHSITHESSTSPETESPERFKTVTYTSTTTIRNRRFDGAPIDVVERTNLPVVKAKRGGSIKSDSAESRIQVLLKEPPGLAESETDGPVDLGRPDGFCVQWGTGDGDTGTLRGSIHGKGEGKFMWIGQVGPGQEVALESVWDVKAPIEISWSENTIPSRRSSE